MIVDRLQTLVWDDFLFYFTLTLSQQFNNLHWGWVVDFIKVFLFWGLNHCWSCSSMTLFHLIIIINLYWLFDHWCLSSSCLTYRTSFLRWRFSAMYFYNCSFISCSLSLILFWNYPNNRYLVFSSSL